MMLEDKFQSPTPLLSKSGIFEIQFAQQFAMQLTCFAITPCVCHYSEKSKEVTSDGNGKESEKAYTSVKARVDAGNGNGMEIVSKSF